MGFSLARERDDRQWLTHRTRWSAAYPRTDLYEDSQHAQAASVGYREASASGAEWVHNSTPNCIGRDGRPRGLAALRRDEDCLRDERTARIQAKMDARQRKGA